MSYRVLGKDDSVHTCSCCGRSNLKFTVVVESQGETRHFGQVCAVRNTGKSQREISGELQRLQKAAIDEARKLYRDSVEFRNLVSKMAERNKLSWDDPRRAGKLSYAFIAYEDEQANKRLASISESSGVARHLIEL